MSANEHDGEARARRAARPRVRRIGGRRIIAEGLEGNLWKDIYFNAMTVSWPMFIAVLAAAFVAINFVFALIYDLGDKPIANARKGLADLFFFSVETVSTVGYGDMHPQTDYGHIVATVEVGKLKPVALPSTGRSVDEARKGRRQVDYADDGIHAADIYDGDLLEADMELRGPAIIETSGTTVVVHPGNHVTVDEFGNLHIRFADAVDQ